MRKETTQEPSTVDLLRSIGRSIPKIARTLKANDTQRLLRANRGAHSGRAKQFSLRMKANVADQVDRRAQELGVSVPEYIRALIAADCGILS